MFMVAVSRLWECNVLEGQYEQMIGGPPKESTN
jgi:hypothetical protein